MKIDLQNAFEAKKIESEFENKDPLEAFGPDGVMPPPKEDLIKEYNHQLHRLKACDREYQLLTSRLEKIRYNYVDDMKLRYSPSTSPIHVSPSKMDPWNASEQRIRDKYKVWRLKTEYLNIPDPFLIEVAVRADHNEKAISVIDRICRRMDELNNWIAKNAYARARDIKQELSQAHNHEIRDGI
jgi:hypothetical protein